MGSWKQQRGLAAVILTFGLLGACNGDGPTQPSRTGGVTLYQHPDYGGASYMLVRDEENLDSERGPCPATNDPDSGLSWDECVSSIRVAEGWQAVVFERDDFGGRSRTFTASVANLADEPEGPDSCNEGWNDCISSLQVSPVD